LAKKRSLPSESLFSESIALTRRGRELEKQRQRWRGEEKRISVFQKEIVILSSEERKGGLFPGKK